MNPILFHPFPDRDAADAQESSGFALVAAGFCQAEVEQSNGRKLRNYLKIHMPYPEKLQKVVPTKWAKKVDIKGY